MRTMSRIAALFFFLVSCACRNVDQSRGNPMTRFVDDYFNAYFEWNPSAATSAGFHEYDSRMEDYSAASFKNRIGKLKELQRQLAALPTTRTADEAIDLELLDSQIRAELLDIETLETWRHNPMNYVSMPGSTIDNLMKRNFAPKADRLRSVIDRLKGVRAMIEAMKQNVDNPPHEFTDLAFRIAHGSVGFFKESVADWAKDAASGEGALLNDFNAANAAATAALDDAAGWLEKTLLPESKGTNAIGADNFSKKLLYEEMVDTPLDRLLAIGEDNLEKDYNAFIESARKIDPSKSPSA